MYNWIILDTSTSDYYGAITMWQAVKKMEGLVNSVGVHPAQRAKELVLLQLLQKNLGRFTHYRVVELDWKSEVRMIVSLK
jgi:hypothetical protein